MIVITKYIFHKLRQARRNFDNRIFHYENTHPNWKKIHTAVAEPRASQHNGLPIEDPLKPLHTSQHSNVQGSPHEEATVIACGPIKIAVFPVRLHIVQSGSTFYTMQLAPKTQNEDLGRAYPYQKTRSTFFPSNQKRKYIRQTRLGLL